MNANNAEALGFFYRAYEYVINSGYEKEIEWVSNIRFDNITSDDFFREYVWVVLNTGFKEQAARKIFERYIETGDTKVVKHPKKRESIEKVLDNSECYFKGLCDAQDKIKYLKTIPFIGDITKYHLARNIGIDTVKPDRHLMRLAKRFGFKSPLEMCKAIQEITEERLGVIDVILWRYCNLRPTK